MTIKFVCAECRLLHRDGCDICVRVQAQLDVMPEPSVNPKTPLDAYVKVYTEVMNAPLGQKPPKRKQDYYFPPTPFDYGWEYGNYEGYGDPQLPFETFNDYTLSHETRDRMQCQVEVEDMLMPDNDVIPESKFTWHRKGWRKIKHA